MKTQTSEKKVQNVLIVLILLVLTQGMIFCQNNKKPSQQQEKGKSTTLTPDQSATIKTILSKYNPKTLTAADAKAIHEKFREAEIHAGPETRESIIAAGFDPEKLRTLDPPKSPDNRDRSKPPSTEERMKILQEKVIKPLSLSSTQNETITKAFQEFYSGMENMKKTQADPPQPVEKSKIDPLEKTRDDKIKQVLSTEQFTKYMELEKASRPPRPGGTAPKKN